MNNLPNDVQLIVYKYLHCSLKMEINKEYESEYLNQGWWNEDKECFRFVDGSPRMMFRIEIISGEWGYELYNIYNNIIFVYTMFVHNKKGTIVADLPKNY